MVRPSLYDQVLEALSRIKAKSGTKGVSIQRVKIYLKEHHGVDVSNINPQLRKVLAKGLEAKTIIRPKASSHLGLSLTGSFQLNKGVKPVIKPCEKARSWKRGADRELRPMPSVSSTSNSSSTQSPTPKKTPKARGRTKKGGKGRTGIKGQCKKPRMVSIATNTEPEFLEPEDEGTHEMRSLLDLPEDVLYQILDACSITSLGRLAQTCKHLEQLVQWDLLWKKKLKSEIVVKGYMGDIDLCHQDQCMLARSWQVADEKKVKVCQHRQYDLKLNAHPKSKVAARVQLEENLLWTSDLNYIKCHQIQWNGRGVPLPKRGKTFTNKCCITMFMVKEPYLTVGLCDGSVWLLTSFSHGWSISTILSWHQKMVDSIDSQFSSGGHMVYISGSRDSNVFLWSMDTDLYSPTIASSVRIVRPEPVHAVAFCPDVQSFVIGTFGKVKSPLTLWNTDRQTFLSNLGYKAGPAVKDIQFESNDLMYTCGSGSKAWLWDLRTSCKTSVSKWTDPDMLTVNCVRSDRDYAFLTGTSSKKTSVDACVRLWDKRKEAEPVQSYHLAYRVKDVYSLAFSGDRLYTTTNWGVTWIDFLEKSQDPRKGDYCFC